MKFKVTFILPLIVIWSSCIENESKYIDNNVNSISVSVDTIDDNLVVVDSILDSQISIKRICDRNLDLVHRYYNDTNKVFIYEFLKGDSVMFSIIREVDKNEVVHGSNILFLGSEIDSDPLLICEIYVSLPVITDKAELSFYESSNENETHQLFSKSITNSKNLIEVNIDLDKSYFIKCKLTLNSGNTYEFIHKVDLS